MAKTDATTFDWLLAPPSHDYDNTIDNVLMAAEQFEFDVLGRQALRSDRESSQFKAIISAYVCNALCRETPTSGFEIDFSSAPCPFVDEQEIALEVLELLSHSDLNFLEVIAESDDENGNRQISVRATSKLLGVHNAGASLSLSMDDPYDTSDELTIEEDGAPTDEAPSDRGDAQGIDTRKQNPLDYSRPLDVHRWADHREVNAFVDRIFADYFRDGGNPRIRKTHVKVVLLDLYVAWATDPSLKVAYSRNPNDYEAKSRYNELHISKVTIDVVDRLIEAGFVEQAKGFKDRVTGIGRLSRIWPTHKLIRMFEDAKFGPLDIGDHPDREVIILRDYGPKNPKKQVNIGYDDTGDTNAMRFRLQRYNDLLRRTFIDIPTLEIGFIELSPESDGKRRRLHITQQDKTVRRIFNRGSFEKGGRFWGGWWQRCPKEWREKIYINNVPTVEIDYSGHHLVMLYANAGIDYWKAVGTDPYTLELPNFEGTESDLRQLCKELTLIALNAKNDTAAFLAFRDEADTGSLQKRMTNNELGQILSALREKHQPIAHKFASDAGIDLMSQDARIAERVINHFTRQGIPVLCIHDSFIGPLTLADELQRVMLDAFQKVTGAEQAKMDTVAKGIRYFPLKDSPPKPFSKPRKSKSDPAIVLKPAKEIIPRFTERYVHNRDRFYEWLQKSTRTKEHQREVQG